jgi:hypothetical protein
VAEIFPTGLQLQDLLTINNMLKVVLVVSPFNTMGGGLFFNSISITLDLGKKNLNLNFF